MMRVRSLTLTGAAAVLLIAGLWLSLHRSQEQAGLEGGNVFPELTAALGDVNEIRLSKGDGSRVTLRREDGGWIVVERNYPADTGRVRDLALSLARMTLIERKTREPANYPKLGVETPDTPTATGTRVEVVAGERTWALIVGKNAEGRAIYVRKPEEAASALVEPAVTVDPDPKRWLDRQILDIDGQSVHEISVNPSSGTAYRLTRESRDASSLVLSPIPRGRKPASSMSLDAQAEALSAFNFDDMRPLPASPAPASDHATWQLFDGQVLEFAGRKEGGKAYITLTARHDAALAAKFPVDTPAGTATPELPAPAVPAALPAAESARSAELAADRLATRARGLEFEIPLYKYESLFKAPEDLLEPRT